MSDKYIIMLQITETKKVKDLDVATHVIVQLQRTDPDIKSKDRVVKKSEKSGLYEAMDIATVWLDRALTAE
jgi:arginyl-tRNA synthetase